MRILDHLGRRSYPDSGGATIAVTRQYYQFAGLLLSKPHCIAYKPLEWVPDGYIENQVVVSPCGTSEVNFIGNPLVAFQPWFPKRHSQIEA